VTGPDVRFEPADPVVPPAADLLRAMTDELVAMYGSPDGGWERVLDPTELAPPRGRYLVGRIDGEIVAGGGVRILEPGIGEVKRMYVVPARRRRGIAAALLQALEDEARVMGCTRLRLDTGPKQPHAQRLYLRSGYDPVPDYNDNPKASFWGEKLLS